MKKRTASAIGRQNRAKGAAFEREVVAALLPLYPECRRNLSQTRSARREGPDILGVPWWLELTCGRVTEGRIEAKLDQAWHDSHEGRAGAPVVVYKPHGRPARVRLPMRTLGVADAMLGAYADVTLAHWIALLERRSNAITQVAPLDTPSARLATRWQDPTEAA